MVRSNTPLWTVAELQRVKEANREIFSNAQQQELENLRLDQINLGEGMIVTEETRQMLIENKFPFPTRWLHDKYKINIDPGSFNLMRSLVRESTDFGNPFDPNAPPAGTGGNPQQGFP